MRRWWRRWRTRKQPTADWCATCHRDLLVGDVWEVRSGHEFDPEVGGGTYVAQTFCRKHRPSGAVRG